MSQGSDRRRWFALAIVMTAAFMDLVDVTIVNVAIPSIQRDEGASFSHIQWITAGYALALGAGLITGGRLGDIYGRKRIFLLGITGFTVASALCGFAVNPDMLVASRILQGGMAALMVPQVLSIVHATFPAHERGKVFGLFGMVVGLGAVSGPLLGALLTEWNLFGLEWRPIFLINLPVGIAGLLLGRKFIEESKAPKALKLDLVGVVLVTVGALMLLYPLTRGRELDWPVWGYVMMAGALVVFGALVAYEKHKTKKDGSPLIELSLFKVKSFAGGIAVQTVFGVSLGIFFLVWTMYMQVGLGWSALHAGLTGVPFSIAVSAAAGLSVQQLVPRFGRKVLQAGALTMAAGVLIYIWEADRYGAGIASWQMALPLVVMGLGMGLIVAPLTDAILSDVPREHAGSASGLLNTVQQMGNAFGLGLVSVVFYGVIDEKVTPDRIPAEYINGFEHALWWVVAVLVAIFLLMLALPKRPKQHIEGAQDSGDEAGAPAEDAVKSREPALTP
ncbi:putative actinorhodin transporter [Streptomyces aurantiacus JA 4570]|uniref:Putative actinorhodin transporter n=1 Tax=Streptomyces aurantiacus JA 4570 TaxID=1286094 RepID=S3ZQM4_9ACTN|nr:putative actinorhodin transporter [Streptomyces aurantiacus JA 4570]